LNILNSYNLKKSFAQRIFFAIISFAGLMLVYLNQHFDYLSIITNGLSANPNFIFAFNRIVRFTLNDLFAILLIWAIFYEKKYVVVAFLVQLVGLFIIMPTYLIFKLTLEGDSEISSPLLSFLHRLIIHPFLIFLLIPAFYLQRKS